MQTQQNAEMRFVKSPLQHEAQLEIHSAHDFCGKSDGSLPPSNDNLSLNSNIVLPPLPPPPPPVNFLTTPKKIPSTKILLHNKPMTSTTSLDSRATSTSPSMNFLDELQSKLKLRTNLKRNSISKNELEVKRRSKRSSITRSKIRSSSLDSESSVVQPSMATLPPPPPPPLVVVNKITTSQKRTAKERTSAALPTKQTDFFSELELKFKQMNGVKRKSFNSDKNKASSLKRHSKNLSSNPVFSQQPDEELANPGSFQQSTPPPQPPPPPPPLMSTIRLPPRILASSKSSPVPANVPPSEAKKVKSDITVFDELSMKLRSRGRID